MSTIDGVMKAQYATTTSADKGGSTGSNGLSVSDFYKLLAAQLQYQDADNPMDTSEMMAQMVQTQMIEAITQMTTTNTISYATSMVGKTVTMAEIDEFGMFTNETTTGVVTGVLLGDNPVLYIGDKGYLMAQVMTVGEVPKAPEDPDNGGDAGDGEGDTGGGDGNTEVK